jgi:hypothetical protein
MVLLVAYLIVKRVNVLTSRIISAGWNETAKGKSTSK